MLYDKIFGNRVHLSEAINTKVVNQNVEMIQEMILNVAIEYVVNHKVDKFMACGSCTAQVMAMNKRLE